MEITQKQMNINSSNLQKTGEIKLNFIDQSVKQSNSCMAIAFDSSNSIMVSTEQKDIKVWRFRNGKFELIKTLQGHTDWIYCIIYSGHDATIRCWKQQDSSNGTVHSLINSIQAEYLLFSGSSDKTIKVWDVDFNQNILKYLYSLDKHDNYVAALSLNQSETQLVQCANGKNQIIIWERREQDQFKFKYFVKQSIQNGGKKIKFIKENQFIWVTGDKEIDKLFVFELKEGVFQEKQEKTIQLIANNWNGDMFLFPIVYNKERNLIVARHKTYIYMIREMNDGQFKIVGQLNCDTNDIYGTITNNGQYLIY